MVTGQFFSEGDRLHLTLETIAVEKKRVVWRGRVSAPVEDLLSLREEVADQVRSALLPELGISVVDGSAGPRPTNAEAYELYVRSLSVPNRAEPNKKAIEMLERSIALDPHFAPAYASLGMRYYHDGWYSDGGEAAVLRSERLVAEAG